MKVFVVGWIFVCSLPSVAHAIDFKRTVNSGQTAHMHDYKSWDRNCVSNSGVVKVLGKPQHGKLTGRNVDGKIGNSRTRGATHCKGTPIKVFRVHYTSARGFHGLDSFTIGLTTGIGREYIDTYTVTVK